MDALWPADAARKIRIESAEGLPGPAPGANGHGRSSVRRGDSERFYVVPHGGSWRVVVDPLEGFEPIPPIEVTLAEGEVRPVAIPVRRTR